MSFAFSQILTPASPEALSSVATSVAVLDPEVQAVAVSVAAILPEVQAVAVSVAAILPEVQAVAVSVAALTSVITTGLISATADSAANTTLTQTISSVASQSIYLFAFGVTVSGAALTSTVVISIIDDVTTIYKTTIGIGAPIGESRYREFAAPIKGTSGKSLTLQATAGGGSVVMVGNLVYTQR
jgi:hypothetical protein